MSWTLPASIRAALDQANALWPARSTASDGTIGDAAHAGRTSDHNPDDHPDVADGRDPDRRREVHAFDLTHDPANGVDCDRLAEHLRTRVLAGAERRAAYLIWNRRIFNPSVSPAWRPYSGANPHDKHLHVSLRYSDDAENDTSPWWPNAAADRPARRNPTMLLARWHADRDVRLFFAPRVWVPVEDGPDFQKALDAGIPSWVIEHPNTWLALTGERK